MQWFGYHEYKYKEHVKQKNITKKFSMRYKSVLYFDITKIYKATYMVHMYLNEQQMNCT